MIDVDACATAIIPEDHGGMNGLSIIVPAHDNAAVVCESLSIECAIARLHEHADPGGAPPCEVVVDDDGSQDDTHRVVAEHIRGRDHHRLIGRAQPRGAVSARDLGAAAGRGDVLCFLDADDLFLPDHLLTCCKALRDPAVDFVKTGVELDDPVHPVWHVRIVNSW